MALNDVYHKAAARMFSRLLGEGVPEHIIESKYCRFISRINDGSFTRCQICDKSIPFVVLNEQDFFRTTCSNSCEETLQLSNEHQEEKEGDLLREMSKDIIGDLLPNEMHIMAHLNTKQYQRKFVMLIAADISEVEKHGVNAMVTIVHDEPSIPNCMRIAAFEESEQQAIITSLIESVSIHEARKILTTTAMNKIARMQMFSSK
jgi:hypothetical protein